MPKGKLNNKIPIVVSFQESGIKEKFMSAQKSKKIILSDDCKFPGDSLFYLVQKYLHGINLRSKIFNYYTF